MNPTVGRIVHYIPDPDEDPLAAIIVYVWSDNCVNLTVFDADGGTHSRTSVPFGGAPAGVGGFATWPARAEG